MSPRHAGAELVAPGTAADIALTLHAGGLAVVPRRALEELATLLEPEVSIKPEMQRAITDYLRAWARLDPPGSAAHIRGPWRRVHPPFSEAARAQLKLGGMCGDCPPDSAVPVAEATATAANTSAELRSHLGEALRGGAAGIEAALLAWLASGKPLIWGELFDALAPSGVPGEELRCVRDVMMGLIKAGTIKDEYEPQIGTWRYRLTGARP